MKSWQRLLLSSLLLYHLTPAGAVAEEVVRGDLPHSTAQRTAMLEQTIAGSDASQLFEELRALLLSRVGSDLISEEQLYLGAIEGMLTAVESQLQNDESPTKAALPPSTLLLGAQEVEGLDHSLDGYMTGLGIELQLNGRSGALVVAEVLDNSPAQGAGIEIGDRIIAIDRMQLRGRLFDEMVNMLRGSEGSSVLLTLERPAALIAQRFSVTIQRRQFRIPSASGQLRSDNVGHLRIARFHRSTPKEVRRALNRLTEQGADRLILDLRNNSGGDLMAALEVADLFVPPETVLLRMVEPGVGAKDLLARQPCLSEAPLAILVDRWTLGAAESIAAALQAQGRAYLIGEPTMGSARTETLISLSQNLWLRLESVRLRTPTGDSWQREGLRPDLTMWHTDPLASPTARDHSGWSGDPLVYTAVHYLTGQNEATP
ncbi:MAG: hypothetical protein CMP23_04915 [Rickettsiales bacterium]|nr:hypothetical protein [Rickettsiales bacterium]|tara:strand:- start:1090 stop:2382 length:1293 start_codon:yes stop_codon:yes gene_type:complete